VLGEGLLGEVGDEHVGAQQELDERVAFARQVDAHAPLPGFQRAPHAWIQVCEWGGALVVRSLDADHVGAKVG
jgi:hypothetical protein